jgi:1-acyl-sn-glycerol-3-phosphate acyltransferase
MKGALRSAFLWSAIAAGTTAMYVVGLPIFLVTMPFDPQRRVGHWYATHWGRLILKLNRRWTVEVRGQERIPRDRALVVVSNHQGMGDIMMAFCLDLHFKWISKAANFYVPCMGWFMYHAGYIPLHRGNRSSIVQCMARAGDYLREGVSVLFFPEGTRSTNGQVGTFKPGAFRLALQGGFDILPIAITGTMDALPKHSWKFPDERAEMKLAVGKPISTRGRTEADLEALIAEARRAVIALKEGLDGQEPAVEAPPLAAATLAYSRPASTPKPLDEARPASERRSAKQLSANS